MTPLRIGNTADDDTVTLFPRIDEMIGVKILKLQDTWTVALLPSSVSGEKVGGGSGAGGVQFVAVASSVTSLLYVATAAASPLFSWTAFDAA